MLMAVQMPFSAFASTSTKSKYTSKTYTHQTRFDTCEKINGIDVSEWNDKIDWKKVKAAGIDFAFIRVGYTGYRTDHLSLNYDRNYITNITEAIKAGVAVGVYWYSQAVTTSDARQEAKKLVAVLDNYSISLPVVMDYEFAGVSTGRLDSANLSKSRMTNNALAFLDEVNKAGYEGCLYACMSFLNNHMYADQISDTYKIWLAHYTTSTSYDGDFDYWQYSSSGKVNGIGGSTDMNYFYLKNDSSSIGDHIYTGEPITPSPIVSVDDNILVEGEDYTLSYKNNKNIGTATVIATGINDYEGESWQYRFTIIPDTVKTITIKGRTTTSLDFSWSEVKGTNTYCLNVTNNTKGTSFTQLATGTSATLSNLTPANEYSVRVRAYKLNSAGKKLYGGYSGTNTKHTVADKVTGLKTASRTVNSIKLKWDKKPGADGYRIYRYIPSKDKYVELCDVMGGSTTSYTVKNLSVGSIYNYRVSAFNVENGAKKVGYKSNMLTDTPKPNTVTVTKKSSPSSKRLTLRLYRVKCTGYQLQYSTTKNFSSNVKSVRINNWNTNNKTVDVPKGKTTYYVRIRAYKNVSNNKNIYGSWSKTQVIKVK